MEAAHAQQSHRDDFSCAPQAAKKRFTAESAERNLEGNE